MRHSSLSYHSPWRGNWCWTWRLGQAYLFPRQSPPRRRHPPLPPLPLDLPLDLPLPPGHGHGPPMIARSLAESAFCSSILPSIFDRRVVSATEGTTTMVVRRAQRFQARLDSGSLLVVGAIGLQPQPFPMNPRCPSFSNPGRSTSPGKIVNVALDKQYD